MSENKTHFHYFKPVGHLTEVDVYRVCDLFQVSDYSGSIHHAIKKLLLPGGRGAGKSMEKDIQEAIDSLQRKLEMLKEDKRPTTVLGIPFVVENSLRAFDTFEELQKAIIGKPIQPDKVYITTDLFRALKLQAMKLGVPNEESDPKI